MTGAGTSRPVLRVVRWIASVALWIAMAVAVMRTLAWLGVPEFAAWAVAFLAATLFIEPESYGRRAVRRLRHGRTDGSS